MISEIRKCYSALWRAVLNICFCCEQSHKEIYKYTAFSFGITQHNSNKPAKVLTDISQSYILGDSSKRRNKCRNDVKSMFYCLLRYPAIFYSFIITNVQKAIILIIVGLIFDEHKQLGENH